MGLQAEWNGMRFEVAPGSVRPVSSLSTSRGISVERNEDKEGEPATQAIAFELQTVDLSYTVARSATGEDPRAVYGSWWGMPGIYAPLYVGGRQFGSCLFMLSKVSASDVTLDNAGEWLACTIQLSFEEYAEDESGLKVDKRADSGALRSGLTTQSATSAVDVGPSDAQRQGKMPSNPGM